MRAAGYRFQISAPEIDEKTDPQLTAREVTAWNARRKGLVVARAHPHHVVIAADTVVALGPEVIGKPNDLGHAAELLSRLSGRAHHVYSTVFIARFTARQVKMFCEISEVRFRKLSSRTIREYLAKIDPLDKAGAYAAQGHGTEIIERIRGSYSNVVGLPMERTMAILKEFGISALKKSLTG